jgi:hypothetical protein
LGDDKEVLKTESGAWASTTPEVTSSVEEGIDDEPEAERACLEGGRPSGFSGFEEKDRELLESMYAFYLFGPNSEMDLFDFCSPGQTNRLD